MYIDRMQFSNAMTTEYNSLQGGSVGQIAAQYTFSGGYTGITKKWMHYDRLGNLMNKSGTNGFGTDVYYQDAYGNVLSSVYTGAWASNSSGRHLTTKEIDADVPLYYFWQRWYEPTTGRFVSRDPIPYINLYPLANSNTLYYVDPNGESIIWVIPLLLLLAACVMKTCEPINTPTINPVPPTPLPPRPGESPLPSWTPGPGPLPSACPPPGDACVKGGWGMRESGGDEIENCATCCSKFFGIGTPAANKCEDNCTKSYQK